MKKFLQNLNHLLLYLKSDVIQLSLTVLVVVVVGVMSYVFKVDLLNVQAYRPFDLADTSLGHVHQPSVVSGSLNVAISTLFALILSIVGNAFSRIRESGKHSRLDNPKQIRMYKIVWGLLYCLLSIAVTNLITNFTKTAMGVLKPHFLQECMPDNNTVTSLKGESWVNEKLAKDICTNPDNAFRRSFPSGHASQAAVGVAYGFLEVNDLPNLLVAMVLQLPGVIYAMYVFCLRISNNQHHWGDVLAGAILGTFVALHAFLLKEKQVRRQYTIGSKKNISTTELNLKFKSSLLSIPETESSLLNSPVIDPGTVLECIGLEC